MHTRVKRGVLRAVTLIAALSIAAYPATSDETTSDQSNARRGESDWVPGFALSGSFFLHQQASSLTSQCAFSGPGDGGVLGPCSQSGQLGRGGPPTLSGSSPLRDSANGSDLMVWPGVGIDLHLMSPTLFNLPLGIRPRMFVSVGVLAGFPPKRAIANEGSLTELAAPSSSDGPETFPASAFTGAGSELVSNSDTYQFSAELGLAFPIEILNRKVRIKPFVGWVQYKLELSARVLAAVKDDVNGVPAEPDPFSGTHTREIDLRGSTSHSVNGIGPGIEVELESGQFGPVSAAMFLSAHGYRVLGKRKFELNDSVTFADGTHLGGDGLLADTYSANWKHEIDPWMYRVKMGIRFHYMGK